MNILVWTVVVVLAIVVLLMVFGRRAVGGVDPTTLTFDPSLIGQVRSLAISNQRLAAIKLLRDHTPGLGLAAAKVMVDRMVISSRPPNSPTPSLDLSKQSSAQLESSGQAMVPADVEMQARSLVSAGQKIQAIKLIRENTAWGLREAKLYVDNL